MIDAHTLLKGLLAKKRQVCQFVVKCIHYNGKKGICDENALQTISSIMPELNVNLSILPSTHNLYSDRKKNWWTSLVTMCDFHNFGLIFTGQCTVASMAKINVVWNFFEQRVPEQRVPEQRVPKMSNFKQRWFWSLR